jgi:hypothetical protein
MAEGDYPLTAYVWNRFPLQSNIGLQVYFNHYPNGNKSAGPILTPIEPYVIQPGDMIGFPLFWYDETLIINFEPPANAVIPEKYYIYGGPKVNYTLERGLPVPDIPCGTGGKNSGVWTLNKTNSSWQLQVSKIVIDPETVNVSVGVDLP